MALKLTKRGEIWWIRGSVSGSRIRKSAGTSDRRTAEAVALKLESDARKLSELGPEAVLTFGAAVGIYLNAGKPERYLAPIFAKWEHRLVRTIKPGHVLDLAVELYPEAKTATQNRQVLTPVQAVINHAAERGLCAPIKVKRLKVPKPVRRVASMEWLEAFVAHANPRMAALALFMAMTGTRISNAVALRWEDVNLEAGTALLPKTKNGDPVELTLPPRVLRALKAFNDRDGKVFGYKSRQSIQTAWKSAETRAAIPHVPPHDAGRRLFATQMLIGGIDPVTIAKAGGWKSPRMVLDVYAQPSDVKDAVEKVFGTNLAQDTVNNQKVQQKQNLAG